VYGRDGGRGVWRDGYVTGRFGRVRKGEEAWGVVVVVPFGGVLSICHSSCAPLVVCLVSGGSSGKSSLVSATFHRRGWVTSFPKAGRVCLCMCAIILGWCDGGIGTCASTSGIISGREICRSGARKGLKGALGVDEGLLQARTRVRGKTVGGGSRES
jgi:hypothetical protein